MKFAERLEKCESIADIFELVKEAVLKHLGTSRAGLTLVLAELGSSDYGFVGAYYPVGSNTIVMNRSVLRRLRTEAPELFKAYVFHVLLHEYLHALGVLDEAQTGLYTYNITRSAFGEEHVATKLALKMEELIPLLRNLERLGEIEHVRDFDRSSTEYIM